jgi:hypothetical protein
MHYLNTLGTNNPHAVVKARIDLNLDRVRKEYYPTLLKLLPGPIGQVDIPLLWLMVGADFLNGPETMIKLELDMVGAPSMASWGTVLYWH